MMKKGLAKKIAILALCFCVAFAPSVSPVFSGASQETGNEASFLTGIEFLEAEAAIPSGKTGKVGWRLSGSTLIISGKGTMGQYGKGKAPWYRYRNRIKTVIIKNGVKNIGKFAFFNMTKLTKVTGCKNVEEIGKAAFAKCISLESVGGCRKVTYVGKQAFYKCGKLVTLGKIAGVVTLPKCTVIGKHAFAQCTSIPSITLQRVQDIRYKAFYGCTSLALLVIGDSLEYIRTLSFASCPQLSSVTILSKKLTTATVGAAVFDGCAANCTFNVLSTKVSSGAAIVSCLEYYNNSLLAGTAAGQAWVYSNETKYVYDSGTFEDMINYANAGTAKYRGANCASLIKWVLRDEGIIPSGINIFGTSSGQIYNYNSGGTALKSYIDAACNVINAGGASFSSLVASGAVQEGDILVRKGQHMFVYAGGNTIYTAGREANNVKNSAIALEYSPARVFGSWKVDYTNYSYDKNGSITYIIRLKDNYVAPYYRDAAGNKISNKFW